MNPKKNNISPKIKTMNPDPSPAHACTAPILTPPNSQDSPGDEPETFAELVQPLADFIDEALGGGNEMEVLPHFDECYGHENHGYIQLPRRDPTGRLERILATLLRLTASYDRACDEWPEDDPDNLIYPLSLKYVKHLLGFEDDAQFSYLWVIGENVLLEDVWQMREESGLPRDDDHWFSRGKAKGQIANLIEYLSDESRWDQLTAEQRECF